MAFDFNAWYDRNSFVNFLRTDLFKDKFTQNLMLIKPIRKNTFFVDNWIFQLWKVQLWDEELTVLEIRQTSKNDPRVTLTQNAFKLMGDMWIDNAIVALFTDEKSSWRFSLLTTKYENFKKTTSNPKRYSYILGPWEKIRTVNQQLIKKWQIKDFEDLTERFKVEVVRDQFFDEYLELFVRLYKAIQDDKPFVELLISQNVDVVSFTKNLLWKIIFLYFIQQKWRLWLWRKTNTQYWEWNKNFMRIMWDNFKQWETMSTEKTWYFYNDYLERLFFAWLNVDRRDNDDWFPNLQMKVPYLNWWLFKEEYEWRESYITKIDNRIFSNIDEMWEDKADWILDIFDRYNFTIDEDSLYDKDIAVDPEMLGRIFEKMISISTDNIKDVVELYDNKKWKGKFNFSNELNKKQWAFYTPREIVHYMTQECLKWYLQNKTWIAPEIINKLFELKEDFLLDKQEIEKVWFTTDVIINIDEALKCIKVLDPSVWSWAYPMWLLHEISSLRYYIYWAFYDKIWDEIKDFIEYSEDKKRNVISMYKIKKDIILNNIYGVDIDPGAIDIAKLRFWLSLVVDELNPEPLPNFEFKFVCANSLIPLAEETKQKDLFATWDEPKLETLKKYKREYYNSTMKKERKEIKKKIQEYTKVENTLFSEPTLRARQIEEFWKNFDNPKHRHSFFDASLMFSEWRWFDIIIANPPYIWEKWHEKIFQDVAQTSLWKYYTRWMDYFYFFFHLSLNLLKQNWIWSFITTSYFFTSTWWIKLRKDLYERSHIFNLIYFNELKIFENALWQHNAITFFTKGKNSWKTKITKVLNSKRNEEYKLLDILNYTSDGVDYSEIDSKDLYELPEYYIRLTNSSINFLEKMKIWWSLLWNICNISQWIVSWADKVSAMHLNKYPNINAKKGDWIYVLTDAEIENLKLTDEQKKLYVRPFYKNSDIYKYATLQNNELWVLFIRDTWKPIKLEWWLEAHFLKLKDIVYNAKANFLKNAIAKWIVEKWFKNWNWFVLFNPKPEYNYHWPKIVAPQRSPKNTFWYNECDWYASADVYFITNLDKDYELKYILAMLNSKLYYLWLYNKWKRKGENLELYQKPLSEIPIKKISLEAQKPFIDLVDKIIEKKKFNLEADTSDLEHQIDEMVYELYWLTEEEIQIVEDSLK